MEVDCVSSDESSSPSSQPKHQQAGGRAKEASKKRRGNMKGRSRNQVDRMDEKHIAHKDFFHG